ncbi:MAG: DUF4342 domain-containing protein [Anaerolineae bacterium]|jgi:hypothetical protein
MTEEQMVAEEPQPETEGSAGTEEIKVQVEDLFRAINDLIREGTVRRVKILHNDRVLVDIPLWAGIGSGVLLSIYMAPVAALASVGALLGGCTLRVEREDPPEV